MTYRFKEKILKERKKVIPQKGGLRGVRFLVNFRVANEVSRHTKITKKSGKKREGLLREERKNQLFLSASGQNAFSGIMVEWPDTNKKMDKITKQLKEKEFLKQEIIDLIQKRLGVHSDILALEILKKITDNFWLVKRNNIFKIDIVEKRQRKNKKKADV